LNLMLFGNAALSEGTSGNVSGIKARDATDHSLQNQLVSLFGSNSAPQLVRVLLSE